MKSNSRVLRGWRDFGVKATAIILTILLATQMVGTPAFASGALTNKQASEDIATTVDDTGVEPSGTEATDTTVPDEAAGAANEPAPADSTQATEEPVAETTESATEPATETPAADPAANTVLGTEPEPAPAPAVEQDQLASIKLNLADGASITLSKNGNKIDDDTNPVDVPANEELKFTAQAAEGWQVDAVKTVIDGVETELTADANGEYKVAADKVTDALTVKVEASAVEVTEQPVVSEEPAPVEGEEVTSEAAGTPEAPAVLESEEVVADVASPAFEGYAYVGDIVVKVTAAEGVLPEGTTVSAYQVNRQDVIEAVSSVVEQNGKVVENSVAIDVTLLGPDGNVIQPDGAVNVCFFNSNVGDSTVNVYRVADDASTVQAVGTRQADASVQSFDVDHFSIYVVTDEGEPALATYNFYVNDEIVSTQVVKTGDTLYEPAAPEASEKGHKFIGWYTASEGGDAFNGFGVQETVATTSPISLYAHFDEVHYAFFYDQNGRIIHTEEGANGNTISVSAASRILEQNLDLSHGFMGWFDNKDCTGDEVESVTLQEDNVYLWPNVQEGHWITFDSDGGTYIEPQFVAAGQSPAKPNDPTKDGYIFGGWITSDGQNYDFSQQLQDGLELTARWNPGSSSYTVIYWVENANDNNYSYLWSKTIPGTTDQTTQATGIQMSGWNSEWDSIPDSQKYGLSSDDVTLVTPIEQKQIAGDGSTIVNVYYERNSRTLTFYKVSKKWVEGSGFWNPGHWENSTEYWTEITAKVGQNIESQWPKGGEYEGYNWYTSEDGSSAQVYLEKMPSENRSYYGRQSDGTISATYYVEDIENPGKYVVHHKDYSAGDDSTYINYLDGYDLEGYTFEYFKAWTSSGWGGVIRSRPTILRGMIGHTAAANTTDLSSITRATPMN